MTDRVPRSASHQQEGLAAGWLRSRTVGTLCAFAVLVASHVAAQPAGQPPSQPTTQPAAQPAAQSVAKDAAPEQPAAPPETPAGLIRAIQQRETELEQRADALAKEEERLKILERDIRAMVDTYVKLRDEIEKKATQDTPQNQAGHDERFGQLAKVYEQMAPDDAAARIDKMDETVALKILAAAKPKAAAKILSGLPAPKAARLSERLADHRP